MEVIEVEKLQKELDKKDQEIQLLKQQLRNQDKLFDTTNIENILNDLKPNIVNLREDLIKNNKHIKVQNKSLYHAYQDSKLFDTAQYIKKMPIVGKILVIIKQKLLNWK